MESLRVTFPLRLYRDRITDGVESDGKGDDDKCNDHRSCPYKGWRHLPDDVAHLLATQFYVVHVILDVVHISKFCCCIGIYNDCSSVK